MMISPEFKDKLSATITPDYKEKLRLSIRNGKIRASVQIKPDAPGNDDYVSSSSSSTPTMISASSSDASIVSEYDEFTVLENDNEYEEYTGKDDTPITIKVANKDHEVTASSTAQSKGENTDTGALLQAGSIAAGVLGMGLMMAFGSGGQQKKRKN